MIKYIGSKRLLLPQILQSVQGLSDVRTVLDLFSGTSRVGHAFKQAGYVVTANDHNAYAHTLAQCYVAADRAKYLDEVKARIAELNALPGKAGYFTDTYCVRSRYLQPENGARVDAMRDHIAKWALPSELEAILLVSLMEAADRVDSTCGLQMAFLKKWSARSFKPIELRVPDMVDGEGTALKMDAADAGQAGAWDLAYLDPPYNQHKYLGNYHVWETLVRWDAPEVYGTAHKRVDCREYQSPYNSKRLIKDALRDLVGKVNARYLLVSFNSEGYLSADEIETILAELGPVEVTAHDYKRYVGAQIGIHNPKGERVGKVSHLRNNEYLFLVETRGRARAASSDAAGSGAASSGAAGSEAATTTPATTTTSSSSVDASQGPS